jgi:hypothetical protein
MVKYYNYWIVLYFILCQYGYRYKKSPYQGLAN